MARLLVIGDTHAPFTHKYYLEFVQRIRDKWRCDRFVHIGDEVDHHAISRHETETSALSPTEEGELAEASLGRWFEEFPRVQVCVGNHTAIPYRRAQELGIPNRFLKGYAEMWSAPKGWQWAPEWEIDGTLLTHGTGYSGGNAHVNIASQRRQSVGIGHVHHGGGVQYMASEFDLIFGMNVGCGLDIDAYAFRYGRPFQKRPTLGCGVVIDGVEAHFEAMLFKNKTLRRPQVVIPHKGSWTPSNN